jgi:hypothetical protein
MARPAGSGPGWPHVALLLGHQRQAARRRTSAQVVRIDKRTRFGQAFWLRVVLSQHNVVIGQISRGFRNQQC